MAQRSLWWQHGILYEIVPPSFQDSNGDGIGDLEGLRRRLDYLAWLGVDALWIGPIFPSPMVDFGYDISDYRSVHPQLGTLEEFDRLLQEAHARGLKVVLDLILNHTSDQHPWYTASRSSRDDPKRAWYLWREPGPGGGPPNNWLSIFGGSAWAYDAHTRQYGYHTFTTGEMDLNWRSPEVQEAMLEVVRFWLDRGVDGFRLDACWYLIKDEHFRHNPRNPNWSGERQHEQLTPAFSEDQPEIHPILQRLRQLVDGYDERLLMGEFYLPPERLVSYYGTGARELHLPCNHQLLGIPWEPQLIAEALSKYEGLLPPDAWPTWTLGNHDQSRIASRVGPAQARVAALLLLTLRGTPVLYYGDEIGMRDVEVAKQKPDPQTRGYPKGNRMPYRTPMLWSAGPGAGFTDGTAPWLPIGGDHREHSVEVQRQDPDALLNLYRRLIALRRAEPALHGGRFVPLLPFGTLLPYLREADGRRFLVVLNLGRETATYRSEWVTVTGGICAATHAAREGEAVRDGVAMGADEGVVIRLD